MSEANTHQSHKMKYGTRNRFKYLIPRSSATPPTADPQHSMGHVATLRGDQNRSPGLAQGCERKGMETFETVALKGVQINRGNSQMRNK